MSFLCSVSTMCTSKSKSKGPEYISKHHIRTCFWSDCNWLTPNSMEQILFGKLGVSQLVTIPCILWNPKVHCHVHNSLPSVAVLTQLNVFHVLSCFFRLVWCYPFTDAGVFQVVFFLHISPQKPWIYFSFLSHMPCPPNPFWFDHLNNNNNNKPVCKYC